MKVNNMPYIVSTATNDIAYNLYAEGKANNLLVLKDKVVITGGANRANKFMQTKKCEGTKVTEKQLKLLEGNKQFLRHVENGFMRIVKSAPKTDKTPKDMTAKDGSAPLDATSAEADDKELGEGLKTPVVTAKKRK